MRIAPLPTIAVVVLVLAQAQGTAGARAAAVQQSAEVARGGSAVTAVSRGPTRAMPRIAIASPRPLTYASRKKLVVRYSCTGTGIVRCTGVLKPPGGRVRRVLSGRRVRPRSTGSWTLRVTAVRRHGKRSSRAVRFFVERTVSWSGYTWDVRHGGWGGPGPNHWSDARANVHLSGGALVLSVVRDRSGKWTSAEVDNQRHLGYGTYRWVVASDLASFDSHQVLGMFTLSGTGKRVDEIDIEPSQWGNLAAPNGSAAVWNHASSHVSAFTTFGYSGRPPYVNQFTWAPGSITYLVTDAAGAILLDWRVTTDVPVPSDEVPIINFWRFHGVPPAGATTVRILSFSWTPLRG